MKDMRLLVRTKLHHKQPHPRASLLGDVTAKIQGDRVDVMTDGTGNATVDDTIFCWPSSFTEGRCMSLFIAPGCCAAWWYVKKLRAAVVMVILCWQNIEFLKSCGVVQNVLWCGFNYI
jgi:hypothetical protein